MSCRKVIYAFALIMLSYDSVSTLIAAAQYGGFTDLNPLYTSLAIQNYHFVGILMVLVIMILILTFRTALSSIERSELSRRGLVVVCDYFAVYLVLIGLVAIPHNTMVLSGSQGIVLSQKVFLSLKVALVLITGVIVGIVNRERVFSGSKAR